jgi:hypothetical protein
MDLGHRVAANYDISRPAAVQLDQTNGNIFYAYSTSSGIDTPKEPCIHTGDYDEFSGTEICIRGEIYRDNLVNDQEPDLVYTQQSLGMIWKYSEHNGKLYVRELTEKRDLKGKSEYTYYEVDPITHEQLLIGIIISDMSPATDMYITDDDHLIQICHGWGFPNTTIEVHTLDIHNASDSISQTIPVAGSRVVMSPDHTKIAYVVRENRTENMYVYDLNSKTSTLVPVDTDMRLGNVIPLWSPDSKGLYLETQEIVKQFRPDMLHQLTYFDIAAATNNVLLESTTDTWHRLSLSPSGRYLILKVFTTSELGMDKPDKFAYYDTTARTLVPMVNFLSDTYGFEKVFEQNFSWKNQ